MVQNWIIIGLWVCLAWSFLAASWETLSAHELTIFESIIVFLIIFVGAPAFTLAGMLETILDLLLPEGWDDDDDNNTPL